MGNAGLVMVIAVPLLVLMVGLVCLPERPKTLAGAALALGLLQLWAAAGLRFPWWFPFFPAAAVAAVRFGLRRSSPPD